MSAAAQPFMKFFPQDWRADEKLRLCSLTARGLWIEMLAIMHRSERYGQLLIGGHIPTDAQLAVQVGASPDEVSALIGQLETAGVFSRTSSGAIYSRRMTRDYRKAQTAKKNGKNGGNPNLRKQTEKDGWVKGQVKAGDKPIFQRPESIPKGMGETPPEDVVKLVFDVGVQQLTSAGHSEREARGIVGKWRKTAGNDSLVLEALIACKSRNISNPVEWMPIALKQRQPDGGDFLGHLAAKYRDAA